MVHRYHLQTNDSELGVYVSNETINKRKIKRGGYQT